MGDRKKRQQEEREREINKEKRQQEERDTNREITHKCVVGYYLCVREER